MCCIEVNKKVRGDSEYKINCGLPKNLERKAPFTWKGFSFGNSDVVQRWVRSKNITAGDERTFHACLIWFDLWIRMFYFFLLWYRVKTPQWLKMKSCKLQKTTTQTSLQEGGDWRFLVPPDMLQVKLVH